MKTVSDERTTDHPLWKLDNTTVEVLATITITPTPGNSLPGWFFNRIPFMLKRMITDESGKSVLIYTFIDEYNPEDEPEKNHHNFVEQEIEQFAERHFNRYEEFFTYEVKSVTL
jgi:hypothetical protein